MDDYELSTMTRSHHDADYEDDRYETSDFDPKSSQEYDDNEAEVQAGGDRTNSSSSLHFSDAIEDSNIHSEGGHSLDEREMRRHLSDVESSFLPESVPAQSAGPRVGADDTFVNMSAEDKPPSLRTLLGMPLRSASSSKYAESYERGTEQQHEEPPMDDSAGYQAEDEEEEGEGSEHISQAETPTIEIDASSPAAAAAHRSQSRAAPSSPSREDVVSTSHLTSDSVPSRSSSRSFTSRTSTLQRPNSSQSVLRQSKSPLPQDISLPLSEQTETTAVPESPASTLRSRPSFFHSRQASHASSFGGYSDFSGSDATISADYGLQTGGVVPSDSPLANRPNQSLSRLPSLGSVVSVMERDDDGGMPAFNRALTGLSILGSFRKERRLDPLDEERSFTASPNTPRPHSEHLPGITDTAITRHVQNIQVPDTVAQEFRSRQRSFSPDKRPHSSSTSITGRPQSTLTLKEQNSKIDKLTKENFDLKLKIHFLDQALQNRSDEGIKDMINKNVQFQTDLANERKETQTLRRKVRDLERKLRELEEELAEAKERSVETHLSSHQEMEIEINELRQQLDHSQVRITKLSAENLAKELEKRKMAEYVAAMRERPASEDDPGSDEAEMWKDLLETETARREQAEDDVRKLREELIMLKTDRSQREKSSTQPEKRDRGYTTSWSGVSEQSQDRNGAVSGSSVTLVDQLRLENIELRRDLGAQTSMLTSRNKERERLQQEIEDLKIMSRKGDRPRSLAGDSILDRSASRAMQRSPSRASGRTGVSNVHESEREEYERREGVLRDHNAQIKFEYQDLEKEAQARMDYIGALEEDLKQAEEEITAAVQDLKSLQKERDDALRAMEYREAEYEKLSEDYKKLEYEAVANIEGLEENLTHAEKSRQSLAGELKNKNEDFSALQQELRSLGAKMLQIEDDREANLRRIEGLEQELEEAHAELDTLDQKLRDASQKNQRMEVTQESMSGEITFLREEQESDKIKIGDLENTLAAAQQAVQDEKERMRELEASLVEERRQREIIDDQSKQEVQHVINELNEDNTKNKDEVRRLRRNLSSKENEAATFKSRLDDLENSLRHTLGDLNGNKASLLNDIEKLQDDLERTSQELEDARISLSDKDHLIKNRDILLENTGLESKRLADQLDKERLSRKYDNQQYDMAQRGSSTHLRAIANHETKIMELETARSQDKRKLTTLEQRYREQLSERNNLLLALWNRLSTLCGTEWLQHHSLVNGEVPSVESISSSLPYFNRNIVDAIKQIEGLVGGFKSRIRSVEKGLLKDYQTLEHNLDARIKRMDFLERAVKEAQVAIDAHRAEENRLRTMASRSPSINEGSRGKLSKSNTEELNKLRQEVKTLRTELVIHRQNPSQSAQEKIAKDANLTANRRSSNLSLGGSSNSPAAKVSQAIANKLLRHHSASAVEVLNPSANDPDSGRGRQPVVIASPPLQPSEQRWVHRLKELERRLKAEREARLLDRRGARQRLEERSAENEELKAMLDRERERRGSVMSFQGMGPDQSPDMGRSEGHGLGLDSSVRRREASVD